MLHFALLDLLNKNACVRRETFDFGFKEDPFSLEVHRTIEKEQITSGAGSGLLPHVEVNDTDILYRESTRPLPL